MNEAVPLKQMIGWCQWVPLSQAVEDEAGLIGDNLLGGAFCMPLSQLLSAVKGLSLVFMMASGGGNKYYP